MKRNIAFLATFIATIALLLVILFWYENNTLPVNPGSKEPIELVITKGSSANQIGKNLFSTGLIKNTLLFKILVQVRGKASKIQSGEYRLYKSFSLSEIISELLKGPREVWTTVPEGLRKEEVVERFIKSFGLKGKEKENFRKEFLEKSNGKEGYLFPDTYLFPKDASASGVVNKMLTTFEKKIEKNFGNQDIQKGLSLSETITLSSIIERETKGTDERPIVAGILSKRLKAGWPLQVDATLQYAVANDKCKQSGFAVSTQEDCNWWPILSKGDLDIISPFNTYKFPGLPPTPISNPGIFSIKAVIERQPSPYWFYLHDFEGKIHYASSIDEHNQNIKKYLGK